MPSTMHYTNCPACGSAGIEYVFAAKDNTASGEQFEIWECHSCTLRFTQDVPDQLSIGPYYKAENYISHTNTSKGFINSLYQLVRKQTLGHKRKLINKITGLKKGRILDLGSGTGAFVNEMYLHGWDATGLEPDGGARKIAEENYHVKLENTDQFYNLPPDSFDAITLWHVLEHVHDLHAYLEHLKKMLKHNGKLFVAVPNYTSSDAKKYKQYWAAYDVPRHLYHFSPRSMKQLMESHQLSVIGFKPMWLDSFYISLLSSKYKNGRTNWIVAGWDGLWSDILTIRNKKKSSSVIYIISK